MRLLLSGDLHIGRSSSRVPEGLRREDLRAAVVWGRMVDLAVEERVDAVCLSGDVADQDNRFWEAIGPLERGIRRLGEAGVRTVAVSGNHDHGVLTRLADQLPPEWFTLLGRGGRWQRIALHEAGHAALHIDGWSFPHQRVHQSPLDSYRLEPDPSVPILGLVHGDLDAAASPYAPLELARLRSLSPGGWLLGHVHAPRLIDGSPWVLYPGSPQALDPGETGVHGPWIVEVRDGTLGTPRPLPLSTIWYGSRTIDLDGVDDESELEGLLLGKVREEAERLADEVGPDFVYASLRLRLVGATAVSHRVGAVADQVTEDLSLPAGDGVLGVEAVDVQTLPAIDLEEYAGARSAPGAAARLLLELDRPEVSGEAAELITQARAALESIERRREYARLERREVTEQMAREHLRTQGRRLLTELVAQTP